MPNPNPPYPSLLLLILFSVLVVLFYFPHPALALPHQDSQVVSISITNKTLLPWIFDTFDVIFQEGNHLQLLVRAKERAELLSAQIIYKVIYQSVQELLDLAETRRPNEIPETKTSLQDPKVWFQDYRTYLETRTWYQRLAKTHVGTEFIPSIGKSHQGRDLFAFTFGTPGKPAIFLLALQHAREWISGSTVNYLVWELLNSASDFLEEFEFLVVPIGNPDGYEYTWTTDRLWRKNLSPNTTEEGPIGVDLNRNYDTRWGEGGSSGNPISEIYMGPGPNSEPEVRAVTDFFLSNRNIVAGFDLHSYSQLILRPWGWTSWDSELEAEQKKAGKAIVDGIKSVRGKIYQNIKSFDLYVTTGTAGDWFFDEKVTSALGRRVFSFDIELLPDGGTLGFIVPKEEIAPCGQEVFQGLKGFLEYMLEARGERGESSAWRGKGGAGWIGSVVVLMAVCSFLLV